MKFTIKGHENVLSTHKNTIEFTKDSHLTKNGNCILGVNADFQLDDIKKLLKNDRIKIEIEANGIKDSIICDVNKDFHHESQIVIRKSNFTDGRTLGINANKASNDIKRKIAEYLKNPNHKATVTIKRFNYGKKHKLNHE